VVGLGLYKAFGAACFIEANIHVFCSIR
jgi:hypothetical protein